MSRRGTSTLEALIATVIGVMILCVLVAVSHGARRSEPAEERDSRLAAELLTQEVLERDLRRLLVQPGAAPVTISQDGAELSFWVYEPSSASGTTLAARPVTYGIGKAGLERTAHGAGVTRPGWPHMQHVRFAAEDSPTGPLVRVHLGRHAFAVRITVPRGLRDGRRAPTYDFRPLASFPDSSR